MLGADWESTGGRSAGLAGDHAPVSANLPLMTQTEMLLAGTIVGGFVLLALTVAAFALTREMVGVVVLAAAGATFVAALFLMADVSSSWQQQARAAVLAKYDVQVQQWGAPLGSAPQWKVNGEVRNGCAVELDDPEDPVFRCGGKEFSRR